MSDDFGDLERLTEHADMERKRKREEAMFPSTPTPGVRICERHGTPMKLAERDRSGDTWSCGECGKETSVALRREKVIEEFEKALLEKSDPLVIQRFLLIWAVRSLKALPSEMSAITERRWRDTKVTRPCDGDNVLGYWAASRPGDSTACDVVHYYAGRWHDPDDDEDDYRAPDFWMPLPETPI